MADQEYTQTEKSKKRYTPPAIAELGQMKDYIQFNGKSFSLDHTYTKSGVRYGTFGSH